MLRVLLIEKDQDETNRLIGVLSEANHSIVPAHSFAEASEALDVQKFDVIVFRHVEPNSEFVAFANKVREIDGRNGENKTRLLSRRPAPANSAGEDSARCNLVDAYLPDDFGPTVLTEAIINLAQQVNRSTENALPVLEKEEFREQVGYDADLLCEIIELFLTERQDEIPRMKTALEARDFVRLSKLAHTMKGSLGSLHAKRARLRAQDLEYAAKASHSANCLNALRDLEAELDLLEPILKALRDHPED